MAKLKLQLTTANILTCVLFVLVGILLIVLGATGLLSIMMTIAGVLFIAYGCYNVFLKNYIEGIIEIVIGAVIIICGWVIAQYVLLIFGILLIVKGAYDLITMIINKKLTTTALVVACVTIVIGILLCVAPFAIGDIICFIVGAIFIVNGVLALFGKSLA